MRQHCIQGQFLAINDGIGCADRGGVVSIACSGHGKSPHLRIFERVSVVTAQGGSGIEDFERIDRQSFEGGETDPGSEQIVWMGWDSEAAAGVNQIAYFVS